MRFFASTVVVCFCAANQYSKFTGIFLRFQTEERVVRVKISPTCHFPTGDEIQVAWAHKRKAFEAVLCNQYSLWTNCLIITPLLNKQEGESEISEVSVTQKSSMWKKTSTEYSWNRNWGCYKNDCNFYKNWNLFLHLLFWIFTINDVSGFVKYIVFTAFLLTVKVYCNLFQPLS